LPIGWRVAESIGELDIKGFRRPPVMTPAY
jgi:hypothetical protein